MPSIINLKANDIVIPAVLNDTIAAIDFKKRLPLKVSLFRAQLNYSCTVAIGIFEPMETQCGWGNGDISLSDGVLKIFFDGEDRSYKYKNMMIIAHVAEENLHLIKRLPCTVKFNIELAE